MTHSEPLPEFEARFGSRVEAVRPWLAAFGPGPLRVWAEALGIVTFVGTSGCVFPEQMKAVPLLRAWVSRLRQQGVRFHTRHRWLGLRPRIDGPTPVNLRFDAPQGSVDVHAGAAILACGGASWARVGSDGAWVGRLVQADVEVAELQPANCGFDVAWSNYFTDRNAGQPLKNIQVGAGPSERMVPGEAMVSAQGIEGGAVYAVSAALREAWRAARYIKHMPVTLTRPRPMDERPSARPVACVWRVWTTTCNVASFPMWRARARCCTGRRIPAATLLTAVMASAVMAAYGIVARHDAR